MPSIPNNNLRERMLKLGYDPKLAKIEAPVLDNSRVIKEEDKKTKFNPQLSNQQEPFKAPEVLNIDDWSDFEDD